MPIYNMLNYKYVTAEMQDTIVGSFELVAIALFTALLSGILLVDKKIDNLRINIHKN